MKVIGVDVGGTFTDIVLADSSSVEIAIHKIVSTPDDPSIAVIRGIAETCERNDVAHADIAHVFHGTTVATNAVLQYQRRQNDDAALGYVGTQPDYNPAQGVIPLELRVTRDGDEYQSWFKPNAEGDWVSVGTVTNELAEPLEVGLYVGICEGASEAGRMTVTFDYFREASSPATAVDPRNRLAVTWGELKRQ